MPNGSPNSLNSHSFRTAGKRRLIMYEESFTLTDEQMALNNASCKMLSQAAKKRLSQSHEPNKLLGIDITDWELSDDVLETLESLNDEDNQDVLEDIYAEYEINTRAQEYIDSLTTIKQTN